MASFGTKLARFMKRETEEPVEAPAAARAEGTRVRPFANEDIYFFVKQIDNSAVIRAVDPAEQRASWKMIAATAAAAALLILVLIPKGYGVLAGYKIQQLRAEQQKLLGERAALEVEEASLMSPERMQILAKQQQFIDPASEQVVYLENPSDARITAAVDMTR